MTNPHEEKANFSGTVTAVLANFIRSDRACKIFFFQHLPYDLKIFKHSLEDSTSVLETLS